MGFIYDSHGHITIEGRRESFIIHHEMDTPHPEFDLEDLDDLIKALQEYRETETKQ